LKNANDIKIKITAGKTNENENYYKRKNENEKSGQTIQQYYANLPWDSNANITWLLVK